MIFYNEFVKNRGILSITGVRDTLSAYLTSQLYRVLNRNILVITASSDEAQKYTEELSFFMGNEFSERVFYFPSYDISFLKQSEFCNEISSSRISCLYNLLEATSNVIVVTDLCGAKQKVIPKEVLIENVNFIEIGKEIDSENLTERLIEGGYKRTSIVEDFGDFCVRGSVVDFFCPMYRNPIRIEMFGNSIESIRLFSPINQRTLAEIDEAVILPTRETVFEKNKLNSIFGRIRMAAVKQELSSDYVRKVISDIKDGNTFSNMGLFAPIIYEYMDSLFEYLSESAVIITLDYSKLVSCASKLEKKICLKLSEINKLEPKELYVTSDDLFLRYSEVKKEMLKKNIINYKRLQITKSDEFVNIDYIKINGHYNDDFRLAMEKAKNNSRPFLPLFDLISKCKTNNYLIVLTCTSNNQIERLESVLNLSGVKTKRYLGLPRVSNSEAYVYLCFTTLLRSGFSLFEESIIVITYEEIFGTKLVHKKIKRDEEKTTYLELKSLRRGAYIVHDEHGIGRYDGLVKLDLDGVVNEFLLILYKYDDRLYLPIDRMNLIQRYIGIDGNYIPVLDRMGGKSWNHLKKEIRHSTIKMAKAMLKIYSKRKVQVGHNFSWNKKLLIDFESQFEHEETVDQSKAIFEVLNDMGKDMPMDRLICGDVGYGKTEVALRATFIAVNNAKQVALLVPTTVLAEQHYITFSKRFKKYPVRVACLSRFKSKTEQKYLIEDIKKGTINIVIGTHRLLQNDVVFMDLGLLILDEEQRFGVGHKEKLKEIRVSVDVLALTATPIPRTLHLSLMGIRDISIISTPPDQRCKIITRICEFGYGIITAAIRNELDRKGQVFFIHNEINSIDKMTQQLKVNMPEIKFDIAHGRMKEEDLEDVMLRFIKGDIDVLVCTTIIESGIDIPKANTIIINRADRFGLAQIYQIRGRVGRSNEQAYAYLFVPKESVLSKKAGERLKVLIEYSDLGSGFQIAMNDMRIRGGGSILGASQSGHITAIGYDMFVKLMKESITELKGEFLEVYFEPEINLSISAFIADNYIVNVDQRLSVYRRLAKVKKMEDLSSLKDELLDRFGFMPEETKNLFLKIVLKILAYSVGVQRIDLVGQQLTLVFRKKNKRTSKINAMFLKGKNNYESIPNDGMTVKLSSCSQRANILEIRNILIEIGQHVSG